MLVVSDIDDVYLPKPTDLLVNLTEARPAIESVLSRLSDMFRESSTTGSALGPAMQTAHKLIVSFKLHCDSCGKADELSNVTNVGNDRR